MSLRLLEPMWLLVAAAAVPLALVGVRWLRAMSEGRRWLSVLIRCLFLAAAALALAGATLTREVDRVCVVALLDVSGSVERLFDPGVDAQGRRLGTWDRVRPLLDLGSARRRPDDTSALIAFGKGASVLAAPQAAPRDRFLAQAPDFTTLPASASGETNLAEALRLAPAVAPPGSALRVVVISDGVATTGDTEQALAALFRGSGRRRQVAVNTIGLAYQADHEVSIESVESPAAAPSESTARIRVTLASTGPASGTLELSRENEPIDINGDEPGTRRAITLGAGRTTLLLPVRLPPGRVHRFEAVFTPDAGQDTIADNNRARAVTLTPGRSSLLLIDGVGGGDESGAGATLAKALGAAGVEVEMIAPERVQADQLWMQRYDLIVLQNVSADALNEGVSRSLAEYVTRFGGGLVMVGGPDSFGAGGWKGTPIEPILPVILDLPERLISPAAAVVIVIDCSGSMGFRVMGTGKTQQEIANDGAAAAVRTLDKTDLLGVIIFNQTHQVLIPLGPNRDPEASAEKVRSIFPDGGTNLPPALEEAHRQLRAVKADVKHVIVLSDGVSQGARELPAMCERLKEDNIRVTTIAVGDRADAAGMQQMAARGDGTFFMVTDPSLLPRIFIKAVRIVRSPQIRLTPFTPRLLAIGSALVDGLTDPLPVLGGLVLTQARLERGAMTPIVTPGGEPVLAHWNAGVGQVGAFTSDAHLWARQWLTRPAYSRMWTQVVRGLARPQPERGQELSLETDGGDLRIRVLASDAAGRPRDGMTVSGWVHGGSDERREVVLAQVGPGEYEGVVKGLGAGSQSSRIVTLTPSLAGKAMAPLVGGVTPAASPEFASLRSNEAGLARIAESTGGKSVVVQSGSAAATPAEAPFDLFDRSKVVPSLARTPVWHALLIAIIAVYLLDVGCRRIAWDRLLSREFGRSLRRTAAEAVRERGDSAAQAVGRLRQTEQAIDQRLDEGRLAAGHPKQLSTDDARALIKAEQARRKSARAAAKAGSGGEATTPPIIEVPAKEPVPDTPPSLAEAKRRARKRMEEGDG